MEFDDSETDSSSRSVLSAGGTGGTGDAVVAGEWGAVGLSDSDYDDVEDDRSMNSSPSYTTERKIFPATPTQAEIIENFKMGYNQVVTAVPGAGKTTLSLLLAMVPNISLLLITFSKRLRDETKARADGLELNEMDVRTFHSIGCHYYSPTTRCDLDLLDIYMADDEPCRSLPVHLDCVILDESQDMCREQFLFCSKFFADIYRAKQAVLSSSSENTMEEYGIESWRVSPKTRLIVMGDVNQCIFPYKGADPRYLSKSEELWRNHCLFRDMRPGYMSEAPPAFRYVTMNGTNRLTAPMVEFLNFNRMCYHPEAPLVSLKSQRLLAAGSGAVEPLVKYWRMKKDKLIEWIIKKVKRFVDSGEGKPGDIFIICPSIHKNFTAKEILNELTMLGYPCYYPTQDDSDKTDDQVLMNKLCFLTGHSSKGRERRLCFVLGFDSSYYQFMDRDSSPDTCTNLLYVACTRATEELVLCEIYTDNESTYYRDRPSEQRHSLPFLKMTPEGLKAMEEDAEDYSHFVQFVGETKGLDVERKEVVRHILEQREERITIKMNATDLVNFLSTAVLERLNRRMKDWWVVLETAHPEIAIPSVVVCGGGGGGGGGGDVVKLQEDVSDLNGLAIPSIFMSKYFRDTPGYLYERLADRLEAMTEKNKNGKHLKMLWKKMRQIPREVWQWSDYLFYFNMEQSLSNNLFHRLRQITDYDWLKAETVQSLMNVFEEVLGEEMVESRRKGIRPFLEYDLFSSFSSLTKSVETEKEGGKTGGDSSGPEMAVGSLDSTRSYLGSILSRSSSEEHIDSTAPVAPPVNPDASNEVSEETRKPTKSEYFQGILIESLKRLVEESEEYKGMSPEMQMSRKWYEGRSFLFSGALDVVTYRAVWEMKCTSMLSKEHQLQLLLYAWYWKGLEDFYQKSPESFTERERKYVAPLCGGETRGKAFHLFNVKTREHMCLKEDLSFAELTEFVALWVDGKFNSVARSTQLSDAEFLRILEEV